MPTPPGRPCTVPGCRKDQVARGWCWTHYQRWKATGSPRRFATQYVTAPNPCAVPECDDPVKARGWCELHYGRWRVHGSTDDPRPSLEEAFWDKVDKNGPEVRPGLGRCWDWTAALNTGGYGSFRCQIASRVVLELVGRPIPEGMCALHRCDRPRCVNPAHLWIGTQEDNMQDMARKGRAWNGGSTPPTRTGEDNPGSKLTPGEVAAIRGKYEAGGVTYRELALRHRVSAKQVGRIIRGESWRYGSDDEVAA